MVDKIIPLPKIGITKCYRKLRYGYGYRYGVYIKFPCIPVIGYDINESTHGEIINLMVGKYDRQYKIDWGTWRKPKIVGYEYLIRDRKASDVILNNFFGKTTLQTFYRIVKKKNRAVEKTTRSMWCVPVADIWRGLYRYRANAMNESEIVPTKYQCLFEPLYQQLLDYYEKGDLSQRFMPDYSAFDVGENRKPLLYKCNLCDFEGDESEFKWGAPIPGVASHQITQCLNCGKSVWSDGADPFTAMMTFGTEKASKFAPTSRWQDGWLLTI